MASFLHWQDCDDIEPTPEQEIAHRSSPTGSTTPKESLSQAEQSCSVQGVIKPSNLENGNNPPADKPVSSQSNNEVIVQEARQSSPIDSTVDIEPEQDSETDPLLGNGPRNWFNRLWNWLQADAEDGRIVALVVFSLLGCLHIVPSIHSVTLYGPGLKSTLEGVIARDVLYGLSILSIFILLIFGVYNKYYKEIRPFAPLGTWVLRFIAAFAISIAGVAYELGYLHFCEEIHPHNHTQLQHIECSYWNTHHRILALLHYFFIGLFIFFNEHIPRENRLHLILLTIASTGIFVTLIWTVIKEEIFIHAEIFHPTNDTQTHDFGFNVDTFEDLLSRFYVAIFVSLIVAFVIIGGIILDVRERKNNSSPQANNNENIYGIISRIYVENRSSLLNWKSIKFLPFGFCIAICTFALIYSEKKKKYNSESITWITTYLLSNLLIQGIGIATLLCVMKAVHKWKQSPDGQEAIIAGEQNPLIAQAEVAKVRHWIGYLDRLWSFAGLYMILLYESASLWNGIYNLSYATTSTKEHSLYLAITEFFNSFFSLNQALLQGWLILFYFNNNYNLVRIDIKLCGKEILVGYWTICFLIVLNASYFMADWFDVGELGSFVLCPTEGCNLNWLYFVAALAPGCVFFRFHSLAMMIEVLHKCGPEEEAEIIDQQEDDQDLIP